MRRAADPSSSWGEMDLELWVTVAAAATVGYGPRQVSNLHGNIVTNNNIAHASVANGGPFYTGNRSGGAFVLHLTRHRVAALLCVDLPTDVVPVHVLGTMHYHAVCWLAIATRAGGLALALCYLWLVTGRLW